MTRSSERLVELLARLALLADAPPEHIAAALRAELSSFDLRTCRECGRAFLYMRSSRHYRCQHCRWKRRLVRSNEKEQGKSAAYHRLMAIAERHNK